MKSIVRAPAVYDLPYIADPSRRAAAHLDLRRNPEQISTIPELRGEPTLKSLVQTLNARDGIFMTHGCAVAHQRPECHGITIPVSEESTKAQHWFSSYVSFSFWLFSRNTDDEYQLLFEKYVQEGSGSEVSFVIQPAYFRSRFEEFCGRKWGERNATACVLWVSGWGESAVVAHSRWRNRIKSVIQFFGTFKAGDIQTGMTVSDQLESSDPEPPTGAALN